MTLDFRPTKNSPVVDAGENLGTAYELDINGVNQNSYGGGWEIGAHVYVGYACVRAGPAGILFQARNRHGELWSASVCMFFNQQCSSADAQHAADFDGFFHGDDLHSGCGKWKRERLLQQHRIRHQHQSLGC